MKLKSLRIENFRSFADETISLDGYNCFVGQNGAGKSTILTALNIFGSEQESEQPPISWGILILGNSGYPQ
jgi:putative ATP-dependent endonuclease of the OLD family